MRLITRNDTSLAIGLIVGTIVVFQQPLHFLLEVARDVEVRYHLDLVPALTIIIGVFIFHQYRKRQLAKADALAASAEAARSRLRSEELERLMTFSQALANALDLATLQQVLWMNMPKFVHERAFWVLTRMSGRWHEVIQDTTRTKKSSMDVMESMASRAVSDTAVSTRQLEGVSAGEAICFPMLAGGEVIGVLGIPDGVTLPLDDRKALGAAAALIAISLRNVQLFRETRDHSVRDRLTGCFNREHCLETIDAELRRAKRSGRPLSVVMFDIDGFKTINDELGHLRGDEVLRAIGAQLTQLLRSTDVACRYGGDEFLVILPDTHLAGGQHVAETLRRQIATLAIAATGERVLAVTASVGVAAAATAELDVAALVRSADEALYRAKRAGRNRVCASAAGPGASSGSEPQVRELMPSNTRLAIAHTGAETILVADDEPLVHELIRRGLEPRGYTLLSAKDAADAIAIGETHRGPIHLLLTDFVMPDLHGPELAQRIRRFRPGIKILCMSGFIDHPAIDLATLGREAAFLQKPFTGDALAAKVREALEATDGGAASREDRRLRANLVSP